MFQLLNRGPKAESVPPSDLDPNTKTLKEPVQKITAEVTRMPEESKELLLVVVNNLRVRGEIGGRVFASRIYQSTHRCRQQLFQLPRSRFQVPTPRSNLQGPNCKVQTARSKLQGPKCKVQTARSKLQGPRRAELLDKGQEPTTKELT